MPHLRYPDLSTENGFLEACRLTQLPAAARAELASSHFAGFIAGGTVVPLPMPAGVDREKCAFYCAGAVRYIEAYDVAFDAVVGVMDLALADGS